MKYKSTKLVEVLTIIALICCFGLAIFLQSYFSSDMPMQYHTWSVFDIQDKINIINRVISAIALIIGSICIADQKDTKVNLINVILIFANMVFITSNHIIYTSIFNGIGIGIVVFKIIEYIKLATIKNKEQIDKKKIKITCKKISKYILISICAIIILIFAYKKITVKKVKYDIYISNNEIKHSSNISGLRKISNEDELEQMYNLFKSESDKERWDESKKELKDKFNIDNEFWDNYYLVYLGDPDEHYRDYSDIKYIEFNIKDKGLHIVKESRDNSIGWSSNGKIAFVKVDKRFETQNVKYKIKSNHRVLTELAFDFIFPIGVSVLAVIIILLLIIKVSKIEDRFIRNTCIITIILVGFVLLVFISKLTN